jgi:hypothetical protein
MILVRSHAVNLPSPSYEDSGIVYPTAAELSGSHTLSGLTHSGTLNYTPPQFVLTGSHSLSGLIQSGSLQNYAPHHTILLHRGLKATIPVAEAGEPLWTLDTHELYIGTSSGNAQIADMVYVDAHIDNVNNPHQTTLQQVTSTGNTTSLQIVSTLPSGTAPLQVASSTGITNLNADLWDGYQFSDFLDQAVRTTDSPSFNRITSTIAPGTAPFTVASSTGVTNLNADLLDGYHASYFQSALTTGNMTASSPIAVDQTRQVIGGAVVISHIATAGNIHLPTDGSSNQLLKNSGASGTGAWGTVTENVGALAAITTIGMSGQLTNTVAPGTSPFVVSSNTAVLLLNADYWDGYHYADLFPVQEGNIYLNAGSSTWNATSTRHGFLPPLSNNSAQFLDGQGAWSTPAAGAANSYSLTTFSSKTSINILHSFGTYPIVQVIQTVTSTGVMITPYSIVHNTVNDFTVTFIASTSGSIIASVGSPQPQAYKQVTADYTVLVTDRIIEITVSGKNITLYTAVGNTGREVIVDNSSSADITILPYGAQTIEGEASQTIPSQSLINLYSNGSNWRIG